MYLAHISLHAKTETIEKHFRFWVNKQGYLCLNSVGLETSIFDSADMSWVTKEYTCLTRGYIHTKEYLCT